MKLDPPSITIGLLFGAANLWLLSKIIAGMVGRGVRAPRWKIKMGFYLFGKLALLFLIIGLILKGGYVTPLQFLGGFTVSLIVGLAVILYRGQTSTES